MIILIIQKNMLSFVFCLDQRSTNTIARAATTGDSNEETDSSLSDDFKSIQNSIISINRPSSILLKRYTINCLIDPFHAHPRETTKITRYIVFSWMRKFGSKIKDEMIYSVELWIVRHLRNHFTII